MEVGILMEWSGGEVAVFLRCASLDLSCALKSGVNQMGFRATADVELRVFPSIPSSPIFFIFHFSALVQIKASTLSFLFQIPPALLQLIFSC